MNAESQSVNSKISKYQNDTLECALEELVILKLIDANSSIGQRQLSKKIGNPLSTIKQLHEILKSRSWATFLAGKISNIILNYKVQCINPKVQKLHFEI